VGHFRFATSSGLLQLPLLTPASKKRAGARREGRCRRCFIWNRPHLPPRTVLCHGSLPPKTWNREDAVQWAEAYTALFPPYQLLIESYRRAQEVVTKHETLDSQRK